MSAFQEKLSRFAGLDAQVVGVCTDTVFSHIAFQESLGGVEFPLATDRWPYAATAQAYGVFPPAKHEIPFVNDRAIFIVDKNGNLAWAKVYDLRQLPDADEVMQALQNSA